MPKETKQAVLKMIERMPDKSSVEDIIYELYFKQRVDRGLKELVAGKTISHEQVKRSIAKWRKSDGGEWGAECSSVLAQRAASEGPRWTRAMEEHSAPHP